MTPRYGYGVPRCAKIQNRTRTCVTRFGNTAGIPIPVRNPSHGIHPPRKTIVALVLPLSVGRLDIQNYQLWCQISGSLNNAPLSVKSCTTCHLALSFSGALLWPWVSCRGAVMLLSHYKACKSNSVQQNGKQLTHLIDSRLMPLQFCQGRIKELKILAILVTVRI